MLLTTSLWKVNIVDCEKIPLSLHRSIWHEKCAYSIVCLCIMCVSDAVREITWMVHSGEYSPWRSCHTKNTKDRDCGQV